jgi:hypothetical protein
MEDSFEDSRMGRAEIESGPEPGECRLGSGRSAARVMNEQ